MEYNKTEVQEYIINSIEFTEDEQANEQETAWQLQAIYHQFKMEKLKGEHGYKRFDLSRPTNEKRIFAEWLQGLPTNINIEFRSFEQADLLESWGIEIDDDTDIFEVFYKVVTDEFYDMNIKNGGF